MPINGLTLSEGATCSITGGTTKTFKLNATPVKNGVQVVDSSNADIRLRPSLTAIAKNAVQGKDGKWSYERRETILVRPKLLADGTIGFNSQRVITSFHPESTPAEITELYSSGAQVGFDADTSDFRAQGTLA